MTDAEVERIDWNGHCPTCGRLLILTPTNAWWCVTCDGEPPWPERRAASHESRGER